jgi:hypothetical protein
MKFIAVGRVHPERASVFFPQFTQSNETATIKLFCWSGQIAIHIDDPRITDSAIAKVASEHFGQAFVSAIGLQFGGGFTVEITQLLLDFDGAVQVIGASDDRYALEEGSDFYALATKLSFRDPIFRFALLDYTRALIDTMGSPYLCYRALESLSKAIGKGKNDSNWKRLHEALGTTEQEVKDIVKTYADPIRHGNWSEIAHMTWEHHLVMMKYTRDVIVKYMYYRIAEIDAQNSFDTEKASSA